MIILAKFEISWLEENENGYLVQKKQEVYAIDVCDVLFQFYMSLMEKHGKMFFKGYKNPHIEKISEDVLQDVLKHAISSGYINRIVDLKIQKVSS